jgi:hypothetical protein
MISVLSPDTESTGSAQAGGSAVLAVLSAVDVGAATGGSVVVAVVVRLEDLSAGADEFISFIVLHHRLALPCLWW